MFLEELNDEIKGSRTLTTTKIISSGAFGAESAALDVAIKLGFQHGGFAPEKTGRYGAKVRRVHTKAVEEFGEKTIEKMVELSSKPLLYRKMPFGKHKGENMETIPADYLQWLSRTDLNEDMAYTVRHYLAQHSV